MGPTLDEREETGATPAGPWGVLVLMFASILMGSTARGIAEWASPRLEAVLGMGEGQAASVATAQILGFALAAPLVGYLADRSRRGRWLAVCMAILGLSTIGVGLAQSYFVLRLSRFGLGAGLGGFLVVAMTLMLDRVARGDRARMLACLALAAALAPWLVGPITTTADRFIPWPLTCHAAGALVMLAALVFLAVPEPLRGATEGVPANRLLAHEKAGAPQEDYIDLMVNSSYTYAVLGMAFAAFAMVGLGHGLIPFLRVTRGIDVEGSRAMARLAANGGAALGLILGGLFGDRLSKSRPGAMFEVAGLSMLGSLPMLALAIYARQPALALGAFFAAQTLLMMHLGPCLAIIAGVTMPNMRGAAFGVAALGASLIGGLWAPGMMGWVAGTFAQPDAMSTVFGRAFAALGAVPKAADARSFPENQIAGLLVLIPAALFGGAFLLAGVRHLPREMALMLAKLRAKPIVYRRKTAPRPITRDRTQPVLLQGLTPDQSAATGGPPPVSPAEPGLQGPAAG
ncbi:MFS transporter [Isosphaeraceae bacterium EP7]